MRRLLGAIVIAFLVFAALFVIIGGRVDVDLENPDISIDWGRLPWVEVTPGDLPDVDVDPAAARD
ncbi:MAG: hypothetical protein M3P34_09175 [Actinomycetota bacterium]|nr:hypothetical protein [Actinomycetota bacterium]